MLIGRFSSTPFEPHPVMPGPSETDKDLAAQIRDLTRQVSDLQDDVGKRISQETKEVADRFSRELKEATKGLGENIRDLERRTDSDRKAITELKEITQSLSENNRDLGRRTELDRETISILGHEVTEELGAIASNVEKQLGIITTNFEQRMGAITSTFNDKLDAIMTNFDNTLKAIKSRADTALKIAVWGVGLLAPLVLGLIAFDFSLAWDASKIHSAVKQHSQQISQLTAALSEPREQRVRPCARAGFRSPPLTSPPENRSRQPRTLIFSSAC